ncbi:hypothetical protein A0H81_14603 [Grifola frondosa]|uniref:Uncharacterized protein n=1 Tax=Grifola frondosa TaxID=5627 RepID=A0A1C7LL06_GRIFR|nr:hypothetical protein A0H81_14603 [Grifola frondosa]
MLSLTLITRSITAALSFASPAKRVPTPEVSLTGHQSDRCRDQPRLRPLKILKYDTVLDSDLPARSFVVSKGGVAADFTGIRIQVDMDAFDDSAFSIIPAGETVVIKHEIAPLYNFEALTYKIAFQVIEDNAKPNTYKVSASKLVVEIKSDVVKRNLKMCDMPKKACLSFIYAVFST